MNRGTKFKTCLIMSIFLLVMVGLAQGRTITVGPGPGYDFNSIQAAIDDSNDGDTVIVQPGIYPESVQFHGKNITLTSTNPNEFNVVASTSIKSVWFLGTEDANCMLTGFKIYERIGGGTNQNHTHATISHCLFTFNIVYAGTVIKNCDGTIINCLVADNRPNSDVFASAIRECHGLIKNCTIAHNVLGVRVGEGGTTTIENCIIYHNRSGQIGVGGKVNILYINVDGGLHAIYGGGTVNWGPGNIDTDPCFVRVGDWFGGFEGDYHLLPDSPCINAGDPNYEAEPNETDLDGKPRVMGGRVDMGAYEYRFTISAEARIIPRTINLASKGNWITCYVWLPEDYDVADIDPNSVFLDDEIQAEWLWLDEEEQVAIAKFNRSEVQSILNIGEVDLTITGRLTDGTAFEATDIIKVIDKRGGKSAK